ncbi:hypothetical protein HRR83_006126 [Exophiala dermatitidis]|nr:hypothetical protein HRR74_005523 [Exophiala dermatitidis]KAJ4517549.1 hypothetical protein HRR73_004601 [Exophiala dermatitidis]KAJ4548690.1 hypothetical protein HRR76_001279 [Exophiala dermatitidis]KAJ4567092.1 hypothetical protein HRR81_007168 [Exophiala dermatitidis]KAJ4568545.1 hypothetical protein HRR79_004757 [Exophiala dermatitidis]
MGLLKLEVAGVRRTSSSDGCFVAQLAQRVNERQYRKCYRSENNSLQLRRATSRPLAQSVLGRQGSRTAWRRTPAHPGVSTNSMLLASGVCIDHHPHAMSTVCAHIRRECSYCKAKRIYLKTDG